MTSNLYKQYLKLLNKWPVDELKSKDLGQHIRDQVRIAFSKGDQSTIEDKEKCQRYYESLDRLASNYYANKYPVKLKTTATGLKLEHCTLALSPEIQKLVQQEKLGYFGRFKQKIKNTFNNNNKVAEAVNK